MDLVTELNARRGGFERTIGLVFTRATPDEIACEVPVGPQLTQPYVGAALDAMSRETVAIKS